ncbi:MAG: alpha/beta hydrolase [Bacteroidota bacterium]
MEMSMHVEYLQAKVETPKLKEVPSQLPWSIRLVRLAYRSVGHLLPGLAARVAYQLFTTPQRRAKHKRSDELLEKARLFEVMYVGRILKAYEWGTGDKVVLLVHGWESRGTALRSFVPTLVARGYRVVAFDGPAHGNSEGDRTNLSHFAGAIRAMINHIGGVHSIITHSFGGASTVFALSHKEPAIQIKRLVLIGVPSDLSKVLDYFMRSIKAPNAVRKRFFAIMESKINRPVEDTKVSAAYGQVDVEQALIVHDEEDEVVPMRSAKAIASGWPNSTLLVSKGLGHFRLVKNPKLVERVTNFID